MLCVYYIQQTFAGDAYFFVDASSQPFDNHFSNDNNNLFF